MTEKEAMQIIQQIQHECKCSECLSCVFSALPAVPCSFEYMGLGKPCGWGIKKLEAQHD